MLKIKINKKNAVFTTDKLLFSEVLVNKDDKYISFKTYFPHKLKNNEQVRFQNKVNDVTFINDKYITVIDENAFQVELFSPYTLFLTDVLETEIPHAWEGENEEALVLTFGKPHDFIEEREKGFVKAYLTNPEEDIKAIENLCVGDSVICNNFYLYKVGEEKTIPSENENIKCEIYIECKIDDSNEIKKLNCIVPININGTDNQYNLLCFKSDNEEAVFEYLKKNKQFLTVFREDTRFTEYNENGELVMRSNTDVLKLTGNYHIEIPASDTFATNLFQTELLENDFVKKETEKAINPIVNMEKYSFSPVCAIKDSDKSSITVNEPEMFLPIKEINFNFHFRDRKGLSNWSTDDSRYWNSYSYDEDRRCLKYNNDPSNGGVFFSDEQSDLLGYLDFTNSDVLYQKSKLKKSFVRLSFYDKRDIRTQKLLFYSTSFIDSGTLFGKYAKNLNSKGYERNIGKPADGIGVYNEYVGSGNTVVESKRLSTRLTIKDKYNSDASSEGFYLYLFAETAPKYTPKSIYMKVEFNHAGYGRTVPFIMPTQLKNDESLPISATSKDFPINYIEKDNLTGKKRVNMEKLYEDMFIELKIKYDYDSNQYVWYMPRLYKTSEYDNGRMIFNLFEPRINDPYDY